jgi:hypothetical protein
MNIHIFFKNIWVFPTKAVQKEQQADPVGSCTFLAV